MPRTIKITNEYKENDGLTPNLQVCIRMCFKHCLKLMIIGGISHYFVRENERSLHIYNLCKIKKYFPQWINCGLDKCAPEAVPQLLHPNSINSSSAICSQARLFSPPPKLAHCESVEGHIQKISFCVGAMHKGVTITNKTRLRKKRRPNRTRRNWSIKKRGLSSTAYHCLCNLTVF